MGYAKQTYRKITKTKSNGTGKPRTKRNKKVRLQQKRV